MEFVPNELLVFLMRWAHVIAGIMWIGNSFYFMWLDANLERAGENDESLEGRLWMVHSGGFYKVERRKITPTTMPNVLHWFKWEATLTWITGFFLFGLVFFTRGAALLMNPEFAGLSPLGAVGTSIAILVVSWFVYDLFWASPITKYEWLANSISLVTVFGLAYLFTILFSGRGAFIQLGAVFGTLMVLNVWVRILPAQSAMIAATEKGEKADFSLADKAKHRSTHNSYMTLPVLFAMLGGHFSSAANHELNWLVIILFVLFGMFCRHVMILYTKNQRFLPWLVPVIINLCILIGVLYWRPAAEVQAVEGTVSDQDALTIVQMRCVSCHAREPVDMTFGSMPGGVALETIEQVKQFADKVHFMAVETKTMPLANKTQMTEPERAKLGEWLRKVKEP